MWMRAFRVVGVGAIVVCALQCTDDPVCTAGDTRECLGPGRCEGAQMCLENGSGYSTCECGENEPEASESESGQESDGGGVDEEKEPDAQARTVVSPESGDTDEEVGDESEGSAESSSQSQRDSGLGAEAEASTEDLAGEQAAPSQVEPEVDASAVASLEEEPAVPEGTPAVYLLVDRSTSMFAANLGDGSSPPFGAYSDRWEALRAAVALLGEYQAEVAFGVATYTGIKQPLECPILEGTEVVPATGNFEQVMAALPPSAEAIPAEKTETPTADAVRALTEHIAATVADGPRFILLFTDGEPDTCLKPDPACGQDMAVGAVQAAYAQGITTFVVGLGDDVTEGFLEDIAHAGQGQSVVPPEDNMLFCIVDELRLRGEAEPEDFYFGGWRDVAAGTYGEDDFTYSQSLSNPLPTADDAMEALISELMSQVTAP